MPRVSIYTLGCKLNFAESSTIGRQFEAMAYDVVEFGTPADVTVINTCSVTQEADRKCRQIIRRARRASPEAFVVVTGCYAQLAPDRLAAIPDVDAVVGNAEKFSLPQVLAGFQRPERTQVRVSCIDEAVHFESAWSDGDRTRAFLKVQDGCDYSCSFCTIPTARGRSRSDSIEGCVARARDLAEAGFREIVLSGVNIGLFGTEHGQSLMDLLRALDRVPGVQYRISSIEPNLLTDEMIDFIAESERFHPHFHLPLQSGDDFVLGRMRRRYRRARYRDRVERIHAQMPDACIGADVIVGFPAESEAHFESSRAFIADLPVSYLHVFTYSERDHAPISRSSRLREVPVPMTERSRRNAILRDLSNRKRRAFYETQIGTVRDVLWERPDESGNQFGYTDNYVRLRRPADPRRHGVVESVRLGGFVGEGVLLAEEMEYAGTLVR